MTRPTAVEPLLRHNGWKSRAFSRAPTGCRALESLIYQSRRNRRWTHVQLVVVLGAQFAASSIWTQQPLVGVAMFGAFREIHASRAVCSSLEKCRRVNSIRRFSCLAHLVAAPSVHQRKAHFIQRIHQHAVLIVHRLDADRARVIPGENCHKGPHLSRGETSEWLLHGDNCSGAAFLPLGSPDRIIPLRVVESQATLRRTLTHCEDSPFALNHY